MTYCRRTHMNTNSCHCAFLSFVHCLLNTQYIIPTTQASSFLDAAAVLWHSDRGVFWWSCISMLGMSPSHLKAWAPSSILQTPEWCSPGSSPPAAWHMASGFHRSPEPSQRLAAHTPSGARMLQDTGCGNNVTRVLPPCLPKSGFADCLFEGKEASDKHPVLKSCLGFVAAQGGELPLWQRGETEECWREGQHLRGREGALLTRLSCPVCRVHFKLGAEDCSYTSWRVLCSILCVVV